ncbi:MAG: hypothetical protein QG671_2049 [Actinomycetota bacterium]|jgi:hypothetical protein|nr:hypothetical protein [Actinomycetota bacterium]
MLKRLQDALNNYQFLEEGRSTSLAGIAIDAAESGDYRQYEQSKAFWDEKLQDAGKTLSLHVEGFLYDSYREDKPPNA